MMRVGHFLALYDIHFESRLSGSKYFFFSDLYDFGQSEV